MRKIGVTLFLWLVVLSGLVYASGRDMADFNYAFRQITVLDGLPDNAVKTLFLVPDGRLGIRSSYGLSFYDGCDFRNFPALPAVRSYALNYISANPHIYVDVNNRVWNKETGHLTVFDIRRENYVENVDSLLKEIGVRGTIQDLFIDHSTNFWWITDDHRLWHKDIAGNNYPRCYNIPVNGLRDVTTWDNKWWFVYDNGLLLCAGKNGRFLSRVRLWNETVPPRYPVAFRENGDALWTLWNKGVAFYDKRRKVWQQIPVHEAAATSTIDLGIGAGGFGWLGIEQKGLFLLNGFRASINRRIPLVSTLGDSFENDVQSILYNPVNGNLWLGLYTRGLAYFNEAMEMLPMVNFQQRHIAFDNTLQINLLQDGNLLLITSPQPLLYNPRTGNVTTPYPFLKEQRCISAYQDSQKRIWVGTFRKGFYEINGGNVRLHNIVKADSKDVAYNLVRGFIEDDRHRLFINFHGGLGLYNERTQIIEPLYKRHPEVKPYTVINHLSKGRDGCLWIAARQGLYKYDPLRDKVVLGTKMAKDDESRRIMLSDSKAVLCDSRGLVWFGTNEGLHIWNDKTGRFEKFNGLAGRVIQTVVEDAGHSIWVSSSNGLCRISIQQFKGNYHFSTQFFEKDFRLKDSEFLANSGYADPLGNVYLGCTTGLYTIPSATVKATAYKGHPLITSFYLYDKEVIPGKIYNKRVLLENAMAYTRKIRLKYNENFFTFHFSGLNFTDPEHTSYRYRLRGVDKEWVEVSPKDGRGVATYTNLSPGDYTFEVYSAGVDKVWSKEAAVVKVSIDAPVWATWWAKTIYVLLILGAAGYYFRYREIRNKMKLEYQKEKELDEMKYRFFTNISHEFRTLLTLIITPLGSVLKKMNNGALRNELLMVSKNAGDLLQLVNQLLDFRKLEMGGERLILLNGNIGSFVATVVGKFKPFAEQKQIRLSFSDESKGLYMFFDRDKLHKIIDNLLSNAMKFTPSGGNIRVTVRRKQLRVEIEVTDTGCGISEENLKHIFTRFYQVDDDAGRHIGSGIGLNLVHDYVKLHKGEMRVASEVGKGSSFFLELPIDLKPEGMPEMSEYVTGTDQKPAVVPPENAGLPTGNHQYTILVVEDNDEFRKFLSHELSEDYDVLTASDGIEAALVAEEKDPDLIISDIMMPRMNGLDLCKRIKDCLPTSHIPVILLTAKGSDHVRTEGYEAGADAYISKPFDMEVLRARIRNLLKRQSERRQEFTHNITLDPKQISITSKDEVFLQQAIGCIEKNMADPNYMTDNLASDVAMSRMSLYRKVKAVTGQTPADFIRTIRLKYAAQLLKTGNLTVSEVCDKTGFATPQNFTKRFREMFGVLPSQYK